MAANAVMGLKAERTATAQGMADMEPLVKVQTERALNCSRLWSSATVPKDMPAVQKAQYRVRHQPSVDTIMARRVDVCRS